jgi:hypothetical protein
MNEPALFTYFTLSSLTHPHTHPNFSSPQSATAIFDGLWATTLKDDLVDFCDKRLPLISPPHLVTLFQAFHKWETSLQSHVQGATKLSNDFKELCLELLGQNVKLVSDIAKQSEFTPAYVQNMRRFIISKKAVVDKMSQRIEPAKDLVRQPPPLSYKALASFLQEHRGEAKLVGHVLHALTKRMTESGDAEVRRHAVHDASVGDVLSFFDERSSASQLSVILSILSAPSQLENDARATFYSSLMIATMAKYKAGRIYLLSHDTQPVIPALLTAFELAFKGETSLEAGTMALIALQRLSIESKAALLLLKLDGVNRICRVVSEMAPSQLTFFLAKTMIDSDDKADEANLASDPEYSSPLKRKMKWVDEREWEEVKLHCVSYCAALCMNVAATESKSWDTEYSAGRAEGGGDDTISLMLKIAKDSGRESAATTLLGASYAYAASRVARAACRAGGADVEIDACLEGSAMDAFMLTSLLDRVMSEEDVAMEGEGEEVAEEGAGEDLTLDESVNLEFQRTIEAEEKIHSAIESVESGELPVGWSEATDPSSGLRYFFKQDGSNSSWVLPSRSDAILEAFYLSKH